MYTKREKTPQGRNQLIYLIRFFSFKFNMMASLSIMNWMYYNPVCTLHTEIFRRGRSDELALESINTVWRNYQIQFLRGTINYHTVRSNRNKFFSMVLFSANWLKFLLYKRITHGMNFLLEISFISRWIYIANRAAENGMIKCNFHFDFCLTPNWNLATFLMEMASDGQWIIAYLSG